jgi:hypothetical protein
MEKHDFLNKELHDKLRDLMMKALNLLQERHKSGNKLSYKTVIEGGLVIGKNGRLGVIPEDRKCRKRLDFAIFPSSSK